MREGTVHAPPYRPCAENDVTNYLRCIAFLGSRSGGGETPESVQVFLNISPQPIFFCKNDPGRKGYNLI